MPETNRTESAERPRGRRRKDPAEQPNSRHDPQPEPDILASPQQSSDALQKDPSPSAEPDDESRFERVRQRAYELYVKRGDSSGDEVADWLEAERQIDAERPR